MPPRALRTQASCRTGARRLLRWQRGCTSAVHSGPLPDALAHMLGPRPQAARIVASVTRQPRRAPVQGWLVVTSEVRRQARLVASTTRVLLPPWAQRTAQILSGDVAV
jgi:hypothetical protein